MKDYDDSYEDESDVRSQATALLPKNVLGGRECKVGDTLTLKVTAVRDGEVQVSPVGDPEEGETPEHEAAETPEEEAAEHAPGVPEEDDSY